MIQMQNILNPKKLFLTWKSKVEGYRYLVGNIGLNPQGVYVLTYTKANIGDAVTFKPDPNNKFDSNAIEITWSSERVGFVNRILCSSIKTLIAQRNVSAIVAKKTGNAERPLIYLILQVQ